MPRSQRIVIPGLPHHVTHRGNNQQAVFLHEDDFPAYLNYLKICSSKFNLGILGWCLMPNHVHLIVVPERENSLASAIGKTHGNFTLYANRVRGRSGHLWENRFYSCPMDEAHLMHALRYVDRNPVRGGLVEHVCDYVWSSGEVHTCGFDKWGLLDLPRWLEFIALTDIEWSSWVEKVEDEKRIEELRKHTVKGAIWPRGQAHGFAARE